MILPKYAVQIENIFFLARLGSSLRSLLRDTTREPLPEDVKRLLRRLGGE